MRLIAFLLLPLLAVLGCQSPFGLGTAGSDARLQAILDSGELRVGVTADLPPLAFVDSSGSLVGFEIDLINALAGAMGLDARFVRRGFSELIPTLESGEVDLVISGMTMTPERNARVAFAGPYFISGTSLVTKSDRLASVAHARALDSPELSFATLGGTTSEAFVRDVFPLAQLVTTESYDDAVKMLLDDQVNAVVADYLVCKRALWQHEEAGLKSLTSPFTVEPFGIALPADAPLLLNLVQNYLSTLENTGLLSQFKAKWLSDGSWLSEVP